MKVTVLDVEGVEDQVKEACEDGAVLAGGGDRVLVALEDPHCGRSGVHCDSFYCAWSSSF